MVEIILIRNMIIRNKHVALKFPEIFFLRNIMFKDLVLLILQGFHRKQGKKLNMSTALTLYMKVCMQFLDLLFSAKWKKKISDFKFQQNVTISLIKIYIKRCIFKT